MTHPDDKNQYMSPLRVAAEEQLAVGGTPARRAEQLVHELYVYQIELEMQNEQLRQAQVELEKSRDYFVDFYDFAPVGYLTLNCDGMIEKINLTGAALLGVERNNLLHRRFASYVAAKDRGLWHSYFLNTLKRNETLACELTLQQHNKPSFCAMLNSIRLEKEDTELEVRIVLTDITERKRIEKALSDSYTTMRSILDTALDGFWRVDTQGNLLDVNPAYCQLSGYTREELLGLQISDLDAIENYAVTIEHMKRVIATGYDQFETMHYCKDGAVWHVEVSATYHGNAGGQFFVFLRDITGRKRAEARVLATQNQLQATLNAIPDPLFEVGLDGRYYDYRSSQNELLVAPPEVFIGKTIPEILPPEAAEVTMLALREANETGISHGKQIGLQLAQGKFWFELSIARKPGIAGQEPRFIVLSRDITGRKQLEAAQREAQERFQKITQLVPGVIYQFRLRPDGSTCLPYVSDAFHSLFRLDPAEVREDASGTLMRAHPDDLESFMASIQTSARDLTLWQHEYRLKFDDGTVRWVFGNSLPQREADGSTLWNGFITDITERKKAEIIARGSQEIQASRKAVRDLAAHAEKQRENERATIAREVHDELGQVLSVLRMDVALLKDRTGMDNTVMDGIERDMLVLVDHAIQSVRNVAHSLRPMQLNMGIVAAIEWQCVEFTKHNGIPCSLNTADDLADMDEHQSLILFRIVQESLTNVTRHAAATRVEITIATRNNAVEMEIRDNGKGFDPEEVGANKSYGLLGMSERAISVGGELRVTSMPGQGTVITLHIPDEASGEGQETRRVQ